MKATGRPSAPTSRDVARHAGVAQSTVSYVMSGRRSISPDTRQRVLDSMEALGFRPNAGARALAGSRSQVLAIVIPFRPELDHTALLDFVGTIAVAARERDHDILLVTADEGPEGLQRLQGSALCDGIFLMDVEDDDARLDVVRNLHVPVVLIGVPADPVGLWCVDLDFEAAGRLAITELADLGHRTVAALAQGKEERLRHLNFVGRFRQGVDAEAKARGIEVVSAPVSHDYAFTHQQIASLLAREPQCTAAILHNSTAFDATLTALESLQRTPDQGFAVVAVSRDESAAHQRVPTTTTPIEPAAVSRIAADLMFQLLAGVDVPPQVHLVAPRLVRRATSVRPPT